MNRWLVATVALAGCGDNAGTDVLLRSGSRLRLVAYEFADGTRTYDRAVVHDRARREDCSVRLFASGERHCLPVTAGGTTVFDESSCTRVLGAAPIGEPPPRYFVRHFTLAGRELPSRLYEVGAPVEAPTFVWKQQDAFCLGPYEVDTTLAYYAVGAMIPDSDLARVRVSETRHGDRVSVDIDGSDDGWRMPGALHDDDFALDCALLPTANDIGRCVPTDVPVTSYFADPSCSEPLIASTPMLHESWSTGCWDILHASGPQHAGLVYERLAEDCVAVPAPSTPLYATASASRVAELPRGPAGSGRLQPTQLAGAGATVPDGLLFDSELDADCVISWQGDHYACAPHESLPVRALFGDAGCVVPVDVAFVPTGECQPRHAYAGGRRIEGVYPGTIYELTTGDRCAAYAPPARYEIHALGDVASDLVRATRVIE